MLNAHRAAGASLVLTDLSVVDPCFWEAMRRYGVTNLAGVPHTFDLIGGGGNARLHLDRLRLVTQAGGRMSPHRVRELAELGQRYGWDLVVMYGQTEATARIAYLPPDLAVDHPDRVGVAIPGGAIAIEPVDDPELPPGTGEVVYHGPNVMMGYAESAADLGRGAELKVLRTGDLGRIDDHGLLELVGRNSGFAKLFGLRIDLGRLERQLAERNLIAACASDDARLVVGIELAPEDDRRPALADLVAGLTALPVRSIEIVELEQLPRLPSGKPDTAALLAASPPPVTTVDDDDSVAAIYRDVLGVRSPSPSDTFASLGGDSFSLCRSVDPSRGAARSPSHRLASAVAGCAVGHRRSSPASLDGTRRDQCGAARLRHRRRRHHPHACRPRAGRRSHPARRGRLQLRQVRRAAADRRRRLRPRRPLRRGLSPVAKLAAVTSAWIAVQMVVWGGYGWKSLLLVNNYLGAPRHADGRWRFWFFESILVIMLAGVALFAVGRVRAFARRHPFRLPMLLLIPAAVLRFELVRLVDRDYNYVYKPDTVVWCFLLGWAAAVARTWQQRVVVSLAAVALVPGYFEYFDRELRLTLAVLLLVWLPAVVVPRLLRGRLVGWPRRRSGSS